MKLLVLTSRYTATRDIIGEDFGRQTRLFSALKKLNHDIDFFVADYRKLENKDRVLNGINVFIRPFNIFYFFSFICSLNSLLKNKRYDLLIATSDPLWGIIGYYYARKYNTRFLYDLHDNYETYSNYQIPFFGYFDKYVVKHADIVTTVSFALKNKISGIRKSNVFVVQNGVNLHLFRPLSRISSRKRLKLPLDSKIIAYAGSIQKSLGVDILINVFEDLIKEVKNAKLLLVGRFGADSSDKPDIKKNGILSFDSINQDKVVLAINAADVVVIPSHSNEFTKYCFPYKCVEYMACNTPIVATSLGDVRLMLRDYKDSLCVPGNDDELYKNIKKQLNKGKINYRKKLRNFTWDMIALKLNKILTGRIKND